MHTNCVDDIKSGSCENWNHRDIFAVTDLQIMRSCFLQRTYRTMVTDQYWVCAFMITCLTGPCDHRHPRYLRSSFFTFFIITWRYIVLLWEFDFLVFFVVIVAINKWIIKLSLSLSTSPWVVFSNPGFQLSSIINAPFFKINNSNLTVISFKQNTILEKKNIRSRTTGRKC